MNRGKERRLLWHWNWYLRVQERSRSCEAARWVSFWTGFVTGSWNTGSLDIPCVSTYRTYLILTSTLVPCSINSMTYSLTQLWRAFARAPGFSREAPGGHDG